MTAEYIISTDAPNTIIVEGTGVFEPFIEHMDGKLIELLNGKTVCEIPFTNEIANKLRSFLIGKDFEISPKEVATLKYLADHDDSLVDPEVRWRAKLTDLRNETKVKGFRKIKTEWDLIHYLPLRYLDKSNPQTVDELILGDWAVIAGTVLSVTRDDKNDFVKIVLADAKNHRISATFFRQKWLAWQFKAEDEAVIYGNYAEYTNRNGQRFPQISSPKIEKITLADIKTGHGLGMLPIYPQKDEVKSWALKNAQDKLLSKIVWIEDPVPSVILKKYGLISRGEAYKQIHFPNTREEVESAKKRIAFDEYVRLQVFIHNLREENHNLPSGSKQKTNWSKMFEESLPFEFTGAQKRVIRELSNDLASDYPMYRLLQGDVGSGKTELASVCTLIAAESGYQIAILAPTDILATQLHSRLQKTFEKAGLTNDQVQLDLYTGKVLGKKRKELLERLEFGETNIVVGTHALVSKGIKFQNLGLAIIDEMHKFGSEQRNKLRQSNTDGTIPDLLMMSATPIPRTVSQVMFGNLDISVVDELPADRKPIVTEWHEEPDTAWKKIREEVEQGRQAYVVAALVEDTDKMANVESATATHYQLQSVVFPDKTVGLLHGKLHKKEKQEVIDKFYNKEIDILVATSVVEVGVNVPNASVMTILNANRFGIASLHQIRGRVGRGSDNAYCYLIGQTTLPDAEERLNALVTSNDGFWLAEKDLEIRGEGTLFNTFQSGDSDLYVANLRENKDLLEITKRVAKAASSSVLLQKEIEMLYDGKEILA